jgi:hypothetical protein
MAPRKRSNSERKDDRTLVSSHRSLWNLSVWLPAGWVDFGWVGQLALLGMRESGVSPRRTDDWLLNKFWRADVESMGLRRNASRDRYPCSWTERFHITSHHDRHRSRLSPLLENESRRSRWILCGASLYARTYLCSLVFLWFPHFLWNIQFRIVSYTSGHLYLSISRTMVLSFWLTANWSMNLTIISVVANLTWFVQLKVVLGGRIPRILLTLKYRYFQPE